ncbi:methylaspartate mutase [Marinobacter lacisalsi]|uniref:Methylaspartate mutase n=1 Tax=Marinobacter lacisalsi TaxID=475979 RepID=A0ABV8QES0_9GAMM
MNHKLGSNTALFFRLHNYVAEQKLRDRTVWQPRMGFGDPEKMKAGLAAVADQCDFGRSGTITLDAYTRVGDFETPLNSLRSGVALNGYPIVSHDMETTNEVVSPARINGIPVQIRHGTSKPQAIFARMAELGLEATEGGPISYCLPYGRLPLAEAVAAWEDSCKLMANRIEHGHIESFGGCMMGQLCAPSILVAINIIEALFFLQHGVSTASLSYAQGTSDAQDKGAIAALRRLAKEYLPFGTWHIVFYMYMGVFPKTPEGASRLIYDAACLAVRSGCERVIVKTISEAIQIPTIEQNIYALKLSASAERKYGQEPLTDREKEHYEEVYMEAKSMVDAVLNESADLGKAIINCFRTGVLDVPYCLHLDNRGQTRTYIDGDGCLRWADRGALPLNRSVSYIGRHKQLSSSEFLNMLDYKASLYDLRASQVRPDCHA